MTPWVAWVALAAASAGAIAACGAHDDAIPPASPDASAANDGGIPEAATPFTEAEMRAAHVAFTTKFCAIFAKCEPVYFQIAFDSMDDCIGTHASLADLLTDYGYGSLNTPQALLACAAAVDYSTCESLHRLNFENYDFPAACTPYNFGTLADGSPCGNGNQCASGYCFPPPNSTDGCGRCVPRAAEGARCDYYFACAARTTCRGPAGGPTTCLPFGKVDDPCGIQQPGVFFQGAACDPALQCAAGKCIVPDAGQPCTRGDQCALPAYRWCNPATNACEPLPIRELGAPCGPTGANAIIPCRHGGSCTRVPGPIVDAGTDAGPPTFVCMPTLDEGASCSLEDHPFGDSPCKVGFCVSGTCRRIGPAECSPPPSPP